MIALPSLEQLHGGSLNPRANHNSTNKKVVRWDDGRESYQTVVGSPMAVMPEPLSADRSTEDYTYFAVPLQTTASANSTKVYFIKGCLLVVTCQGTVVKSGTMHSMETIMLKIVHGHPFSNKK